MSRSRRRLTLTARARADVARARHWYRSIRPELGVQLVEELDRVFQDIRARPASFPEVRDGVRRALCRRFPYKVFFRIAGKSEVRVLAVYHVSRDPDRWQDR